MSKIGQSSLLTYFKRASTKLSTVSDVTGLITSPVEELHSSNILKTVTDTNCVHNTLVNIRPNMEETIKQLPVVTKLLICGLDHEWANCLASVLRTEKFNRLAQFIKNERQSGKDNIFPPPDQVFSWSQLTKPGDVRVVILGQDPYHGPNQAHGLAFSVQRPQPPPPSLKNMYKEIATDCADALAAAPNRTWPPKHGDLTHWASQGVLLLNAVLTVRQSQPNSHKDRGWEALTNSVVNHLNTHNSNIVFLLWGANAQAQGARIDTSRHLVLKAPHPSPLSASRGFLGCRHFSRANDYLRGNGLKPVDWTALA